MLFVFLDFLMNVVEYDVEDDEEIEK